MYSYSKISNYFIIKTANTAFMIDGGRTNNTSVSMQQYTSYLKGFLDTALILSVSVNVSIVYII